MNDKNTVIIKGQIINKYITPKNSHVILTLKTYNGNFPKVFCPRDGTLTIADAFEIGDEVVVFGNLQSSRKNDKFSCSVFGTAIILSDNNMNRKNYFELAGEILKYEKEDNVFKLLIACNTEFYSTVPVVFYRPVYDDKIEAYTVGDRITVKGMIQTKKTISLSGRTNHYENYVGVVCC